jgi:GT2 family glycosyltransferase
VTSHKIFLVTIVLIYCAAKVYLLAPPLSAGNAKALCRRLLSPASRQALIKEEEASSSIVEQTIQMPAREHERTPVAQALVASVVIVSYNGREKLLRCLESVLRTVPEDSEVIVVDNASVECNADAIEAFFPEVSLIRSDINLGFSGGCNLGARYAQSKYLVFVNPDTLTADDWVEALLAPLEEDERVGLTTARILLMDDPQRVNTCGCNIHVTGLTLCRGLGRLSDAYQEAQEVGAISGAAFAVRTELFERLGGFDEDMFLYLEDTDLSLRARLAGWPTLYTPESVVLHDYELRITPLKVFWEERNRYLMLLKSLRWPTIAVLMPLYLLAEVITWGFVLLYDRAHVGNKIRAYRWVIKNWAIIMKSRKATQLLRKVRDRDILKMTGYKLEFGQAGGKLVAIPAAIIFNSIFLVLRSLVLALVWW